MKSSFFQIAVALLIGLVSVGVGCRAEPNHNAPEPAQSILFTLFTSTREVMSLRIINDDLWVATSGGVLRYDAQGKWQKWTRQHGLPSHEIRSVVENKGVIEAKTATAETAWSNGLWKTVSPGENSNQSKPRNAFESVHARWKGQDIYATLDGLKWQDGNASKSIGLPPSRGTHISALLPRKEVLWAALFGDGLWQFDGKIWQSVDLKIPEDARGITALAEDAKRQNLWVGTRRDGLWNYNFINQQWTQFLQEKEPFNHNVQSFAAYGEKLYVSTLEDGLSVYDGEKWSQISPPQISTVAPRQMAVFQSKLYLRHGDGQVDSFDGEVWQHHIFANLPRRKVSMLFANENKLYAAQWGGWSQWGGEKWEHFLNLAELQGLSIMSLYADGNSVWVGTQSKGIAEYSHQTKTLRWHDERHGLTDDWITCIRKVGNEIYAGTFVGGLMRFNGKKWHSEAKLQGENVTALEPDAKGGIYIATRKGTWYRDEKGELKKLTEPWLDSEVQALIRSKDGLWIGARTSLAFIKQ